MDIPMRSQAKNLPCSTTPSTNILKTGGFFLALLTSAAVFAHGNSTVEEDICTTWMNGRMLHMSIFQPDNIKAEYCRDVAQPGTSYVAVDLFERPLREEKIGITIVKSPGTPAAEMIARSLPATHPNGNVNLPVRFERGIYAVEIAAEGNNQLRSVYQVRVAMIDYTRYIFPLLVTLIALFGIHRLLRTRMLRNALARIRTRKRQP